MNIKVRQHTPQQLNAYDPNGNHIGYINHYVELQRLMEDVRTNNISGYYILYGNKSIMISENGKIGVDNVVLLQNVLKF